MSSPLTHVGANRRLCIQRKKKNRTSGCQAKLHMYTPEYYDNDDQGLIQLNGAHSETCHLSNQTKLLTEVADSILLNFLDIDISRSPPTPLHSSCSQDSKGPRGTADEAPPPRLTTLKILARGFLHKASCCLTQQNILEV